MTGINTAYPITAGLQEAPGDASFFLLIVSALLGFPSL